ncbi:MAG: phosphate/phosphite/phosphonate ABC transporter substrate-binding protein [Bryobacteraceae bacterium]
MKRLRALPIVFFLLGETCIGALRAGEAPAASGRRRARLHIVGSESLFTTVNRRDAVASLKIYVEALGKRRGFEFDSKLEIINSAEEALTRLKEHVVDLLILDTPDYLALANSRLIEPVAAGTKRGQLGAYPYLLLGRGSPGTPHLAELRGKRIIVSSRTRSELGLVWLETLLAEDRLGRASKFFGSVGASYRASSCVLPLFFGRIEACVVDSENWDLARELNPQLAGLRILARSEPLLEGLIAMPVEEHPYRRDLIDAILELHKDPAGEQIALVLKTGPMVRVGSEQFESVRVLWSRYLRLVGLAGRSDMTASPTGATRTPGGSGLAATQSEEAARKERP